MRWVGILFLVLLMGVAGWMAGARSVTTPRPPAAGSEPPPSREGALEREVADLRASLRDEQARVASLRREIAEQDRRRETLEAGLQTLRKQKKDTQRTAVSERVTRLFEAMRNGTYRSAVGFPDLAWEDIPALLRLGESRQMLTHFPINPFSSQRETRCAEGMVALWLVEGIRKGGNLSLAPLCLKKEDTDSDWTAYSDAHHPEVLAAYRLWWQKVEVFPKEKAILFDPLEGTGMAWH